MNKNLTRKKFLTSGAKAASVYAGVTILPKSVFGANDKVNVAFIGVGGKGKVNVPGVEKTGSNLIAFADVDWRMARVLSKEEKLKKGREKIRQSSALLTMDKYPKVPRFKDFRDMMDKHGKEIDAVVVTIPDHAHHYAAKYVMEAGKHVYVEKPLAHTVKQTRELTQLARDHKLVTQMGNQGHSYLGCDMLKNYVESGIMGDVTEAMIHTNRPIWDQTMKSYLSKQKVPKDLDWDLWSGPTKVNPYNVKYAPFNWRGWLDYGCGALGDMACHLMDATFYALNLDFPYEINVETSSKSKVAFPTGSKVQFKFHKRGNLPPFTLNWYDGDMGDPDKVPFPKGLEKDKKLDKMGGQYIFGSKASAKADTYAKSMQIFPETLRQEMNPELAKLKPAKKSGHYENWINGIKGIEKSRSNFDYAGPFTEMILLGVIAQRLNKNLKLDPKKRTIIKNKAAIKLMNGSKPRKGWTV